MFPGCVNKTLTKTQGKQYMLKCKLCNSHAVNPGHHGRPDYDAGVDHDLCDVCYWRTRYNALTSLPAYHINLYVGDDNGTPSTTGTTWWAHCQDLDVYGDGNNAAEAVSSCHAGMILKAKVMVEKGIPLPTPVPHGPQ